MDLKGKIAVVTGVSKGIGYECVKQLLEKGAVVVGLGNNKPDIHDGNFIFITCNVREFEQVESAFDLIAKTYHQVDVLINNAGLGYFGNCETFPVEHFTEMVETNLNGLFYCTRQVIPLMKINQAGHIINIASTAGTTGYVGASGYCATKFAVRGFSESLYQELREEGIKVTCVYPGSVKTDFFRNNPNITVHDYMLMPEDLASAIIQTLETPFNFHTVNLEIRPLQPKGPKKK